MAADSAQVPLGRPPFFAEQTVRRLYAARNGLFLIDPARLRAHVGDALAEARLLETFTAHGSGAALCREGLMVPAFGVEAGFYTVLIRSTETEGAFMPLTHIAYAAGFLIGTVTGDLAVCNTDRLSRNPHRTEDPASVERAVHVPPGWYSVTVVAGIREADDQGDEGWICAFLLDPQESQPELTADLSTTLSFFGA